MLCKCTFFTLLIAMLMTLTVGCSGQPEPQIEVPNVTGAVPEGALERLGKGRISQFAFDADDSSLIVSTAIGVYFYTTDPLTEVWALAITSPAQAVSISPSGEYAAAGLGDGGVIIIEVEDGSIVDSFVSTPAAVDSLYFGRNDALLVGHLNGQVDLLSVSSQGTIVEEAVQIADLASGVSAIAYSPDGTQLALGTRQGNIFTLTEGNETAVPFFGHDPNTTVTALAWSDDGSQLLSASRDETTILWDAATSSIIEQREGAGADILSTAFSVDGDPLFVTEDGVFVQPNGQANLPDDVIAASLSSTGQMLAAALEDGTFKLWRIDEGNALIKAQTATGFSVSQLVAFALYSNDGEQLATGYGDGVRLWNTDLWVIERTLGPFESTVTSAAWAPSGTLLAVGTRDGSVTLWNTSNGSEVRSFAGHTALVNAIAWEDGGGQFATVSAINATAIMWDAGSGEAVQVLDGIRNLGYYSLDWQGANLALGAGSGNTQLWDTSEGLEVPRDILRLQTSWVGDTQFSNDGSLLATVSADFTTTIWDVASGDSLTRVGAHTGPIRSVAWSPDDGLLVTVSQDGLTMVWAVNESDEGLDRVGVLAGHTDGVVSVDWAPDGNSFATSADDTTVIIWDAEQARNESE